MFANGIKFLCVNQATCKQVLIPAMLLDGGILSKLIGRGLGLARARRVERKRDRSIVMRQFLDA